MSEIATAPGPFSIPLYRRIWSASLISQFGGLIQGVGAAWLMVELGGSEVQIALVQASVTLPIMILALVSGAFADNFSRRTIMLACQVYMFAVAAALCVFAYAGWLTPWSLLTFTFLLGCGTAINAPSWQATVGDIVPRQTIAAAIAMNSLGFNIARTVGPALGGTIVAVASAAAAFTVNLISYLGIIYVLLKWRPEPTGHKALKEDLRTAMAAGIRYVSMSPPIRLAMARATLFGLAASAVPSLMPLIAQRLPNGGAVTFGILSGAFGLGAVIGALLNGRLRKRFSGESVMRFTVAGMTAGAVITASSQITALTIGGLLIFGAGWLLALATLNTTVQMAAPRWVVGRAVSLYQMALFGAMAAGSWSSGWLAEHLGLSQALLIMSALLVLSIPAGLLFRLPIVENLNLDLVGQRNDPGLRVAVEPRSGPVQISIRYRILEPDIPVFLEAMYRRRRIHLRDGARAWHLVRDLSDPEVWIEQFSFARWLDYTLHNERRTHADSTSLDTVRALHKGPWPPHVERFLERPAGSVTVPARLTAETADNETGI